MGDLDELPGRLAELRDLIRQAHEATRDLERARKEAARVAGDLPKIAAAAVDEQIGKQVRDGLDSYHDAVQTAINDATAAVYRRFDQVAAILLGEDPQSVREGKITISELAVNKAALAGVPVMEDGTPIPGGLGGAWGRSRP